MSNGNYIANSPNWDNPSPATSQAGAVTWGDGATGLTGVVSAANSRIGSTAGDRVGSGGVTATNNSRYVVSSPGWSNPSPLISGAGAVTWGNGAGGTVGLVTSADSVLGTVNGGISGFSYDAFRNRLFVGRAASNIVSILFLDTNRTLTVSSLNPASGVSITVSPNDINGQGNGVTQFTRTYNDGANVMLTAPATAGGTDFQKWQRDGVDFSFSQNTTVKMDANHTMTAVYVCGVTLSQTSQSFSASGGNDCFNVTNQTGCNWTASTTSPWINITSGSMGSGNGTVAYSVTANTATSPRSGNITVGNQTYTVLQGAAFLDVPISHPFYTEIGKLSSRGVTLGCGGGNYCPTLAVTRGQMAAFLVRAFNL